MKTKFKQAGLMFAVFAIMLLVMISATAQSTARHRLIVVTDIGNEPDAN